VTAAGLGRFLILVLMTMTIAVATSGGLAISCEEEWILNFNRPLDDYPFGLYAKVHDTGLQHDEVGDRGRGQRTSERP
jgi:hypothetical protein